MSMKARCKLDWACMPEKYNHGPATAIAARGVDVEGSGSFGLRTGVYRHCMSISSDAAEAEAGSLFHAERCCLGVLISVSLPPSLRACVRRCVRSPTRGHSRRRQPAGTGPRGSVAGSLSAPVTGRVGRSHSSERMRRLCLP
eukprot:GHVU01078676.1.p1 GENE.GHVU01078676.1~~GHVU01078676.1.p1  ORF type:complete len:142 (-),score=3.45 GHVU01078676.1:735-1160(-)